jgi:uncharacterized protein involved in response to NO
MSKSSAYRGPAVFSAGFRPFFLLATFFAVLSVATWLAVWRGAVSVPSLFSALDWHVHEMIFGYGAAVVAGFLFTAVPNWTGRLPTRGAPLALLAGVWVAGRVAVAGGFGAGPWVVLAVDQFFLLLVGAVIAREIVAGRNWRNLKVLIPVSLFWCANVAFHVEALRTGSAYGAHRPGIAILVFLIMLIGGRIIPSFTRNWLAQRRCEPMPRPFDRFDAFAMLAGACALLAWVAGVPGPFAALLFVAVAGLHAARLARWRGGATWRSPLLAMLHLSYAFIPAGFAVAALSAVGAVSDGAVAHLFAVGAVGTMTLAVMVRATLGHTGRPLEAGPVVTGAFAALLAAALARFAAELFPGLHVAFVLCAGGLWCAAFLTVFARLLGPALGPKPAPRRPARA